MVWRAYARPGSCAVSYPLVTKSTYDNREEQTMNYKAATIAVAAVLALALGGCGGSASSSQATDSASESASTQTQQEQSATTSQDSKNAATSSSLEDGVYTVGITTDSDMFHVNDAKDGKGELTVKDGSMTVHMTLVSENIVNVFVGTADDAQKDGAQVIDPTTDTVTYSDGTSEEVYGFDIPVSALDEDINVAILGKKGKWYDHTIKVSNPVPES